MTDTTNNHGHGRDRAPRPWDTIDRLHAWLDAEAGMPTEQDLLLRILKLSEEVGEVAQAVIGVTGHNPRKGLTHSWQDVEAELCDVIVTAMVALRALTPDAGATFDRHLDRVAARSSAARGRGEGPAGRGEETTATAP